MYNSYIDNAAQVSAFNDAYEIFQKAKSSLRFAVLAMILENFGKYDDCCSYTMEVKKGMSMAFVSFVPIVLVAIIVVALVILNK